MQTAPSLSPPEPKLALSIRLTLFCGGIVAACWSATQLFAWRLQYSPALGDFPAHIYPPWAIFGWYSSWSAVPELQPIFRLAMTAALITLGLFFLAILLIQNFVRNASSANARLHGSARWASRKDVDRSGLCADEGVYVGSWIDDKNEQHYLKHNGPEHILCFAPTRSGKGVGIVVPTLLTWRNSAVVTDLKGELWELTSGWRKDYAKQKVLRFEPATVAGGCRWNPLDEIRVGTEYEVGDVQNIATLLVDPDGKGLEDHWAKTSQALFVGLILHLVYKRQNGDGVASLPAIDELLADTSRPIDELWHEMTNYAHCRGMVHPVVSAAGKDMLDRPERERGSVLSTTKSYLSLYRDPVVARNVAECDFRIRDLMNHEDPVTLYIVTQPTDMTRLRPLVRVLINMIFRITAAKMTFRDGKQVASYKHRLLMMMDEFPSLGKLEIVQQSLAFIAGYGVKCYIIVQDIAQLQAAYGKDEAITSNCHIQNAYPPNRVETAEHLSKLTGQTTVVKKQNTTSGKRWGMFSEGVSTTYQETQRPLLTADEAMRLPGPLKTVTGEISQPGDMVIYCAGFPAIYGRQILFFKDPVLSKRSSVPAPLRSDVITYTNATP